MMKSPENDFKPGDLMIISAEKKRDWILILYTTNYKLNPNSRVLKAGDILVFLKQEDPDSTFGSWSQVLFEGRVWHFYTALIERYCTKT